MKVLVVGAFLPSLVNFRGPLLKSMLSKGHEVFTAANGSDIGIESQLKAMGVHYTPIRIARTGTNPIADIITLWDIIKLIKRIKPDVVLNYTIKPIIYGGLAARFCGVKNIFSMVEGVGRAFMPWESITHAISSIIAKALYRIGLSTSREVFFLNPDDLRQFIDGKYVPQKITTLLNGIGIDLDYYHAQPIPHLQHVRFLMIARLLRDKGIREFIEAAKNIRSQFPSTEFILAGDLDPNPSSVTQKELDAWIQKGIIHYMGQVNDVRPLYHDCHIYVLPSYREGTPRTVLEAMSTGRALITTDTPGCRETVHLTGEKKDNLKMGDNGILVPIKDVSSLTTAMEYFLDHPEQIEIMGKASRQYAEARYDVHKVNDVILRKMELKNVAA